MTKSEPSIKAIAESVCTLAGRPAPLFEQRARWQKRFVRRLLTGLSARPATTS